MRDEVKNMDASIYLVKPGNMSGVRSERTYYLLIYLSKLRVSQS